MQAYWDGIKVGGLYRLATGEIVTVLKVNKRPTYESVGFGGSCAFRRVKVMSGLRGIETIEFENYFNNSDYLPSGWQPLEPVV